ncbi:MAG TPA: hypothetical protein VKT76_18545 [Bradyrhizobium sp.]|nr:hypothetical protein [Bradyrhizobium sp.]
MIQRNLLAILATLILTGCGAMPNLSLPAAGERNNFKGKPFSAVTTQLGFPDSQETVAGQKVYRWRKGGSRQCRITVVMAGDIVDSYETLGEAPICGPYEAPANR